MNKSCCGIVMAPEAMMICIKKLISKATPAYKANAFTAGISVSAPRKKHVDSETDESIMDGPTSPVMRPMCSA